MHIVLTDILTCPRCGPAFGLVVLADRVVDRNVAEGRLGCPNCREEYSIRDGVADLRFGAAPPPAAPRPAARADDWAYRLAALLGLADATGPVLVVHAGPRGLARVAELAPGILLVAASRHLEATAGATAGLSELLFDARLPLRDGSLRGLARVDGGDSGLLDDAVRTLAPGARLVLDPAAPGEGPALRERGLDVLLDEEGVVVAVIPRRG